MRKIFAAVILIFTCIGAFAQVSPRSLPAVRTQARIVIDGQLTDSAWQSAPLATNFVEWRPSFGNIENEKSRTEIRILYDDNALYISGFCHEVSRDSISTELVGRDVVGINDFVGVLFDTYHDKINGFGYYVTPLGEQYDAKYSSSGEDGSWNSVFYSASKIVDSGWTFEMKIPYSGIRFGNKKQQVWGLNISRRRAKSGQQYMWNPTDPKVNGLFIQAGLFSGIENIKPPIRLSLSPYFSAYANHYPHNTSGIKNTTTSVNGGMDVKYGINQSFTLDMTLVPDFGQVQSDNQVLNLTPFEVKYNEYRTFFTEGTELFSKGNLFYSRRIGGTPLHYYDVQRKLNANEVVIKNTAETKLINAAKISGRTSSGLGIGVFNAITNPTYALVEDNGKNQREIETNPLTNYNIVVVDKALKHNSSVSIINTNVWRSGHDYDANITAALWDIYDKHVNFNVWGKVAVSQLIGYTPSHGNLNGYNHDLSFGKMGGRFNFSVSQRLADQNYQQNDMGYFTNNNYFNHNGWIGYKWLKPKSFYKNLYFNFNTSYNTRFKPTAYQNFTVNTNINGQLKNLWDAGIEMNFGGNEHDFYEPRIPGKVFFRPYWFAPAFWVGSNTAKKYSANLNATFETMPEFNSRSVDLSLSHRFRFNDKLTIRYSSYLGIKNRNVGFAAIENNQSLFGLRDVNTSENVLNFKYNFNNKMGLTLRLRHYWSKVEYTEYFNLKDDGHLQPTTAITSNPNYNVNFLNIDMVYSWQFAQGSFINIVWKDASSAADDNVQENYLYNFKQAWKQPQANSLSFRVIYYLDYLSLKKKRVVINS
jgi:hypothetical protein